MKSQRDGQVETFPQASDASRLSVPGEIELRGEWLCWRWGAFGGSASGTTKEASGILEQFVKISNACEVLDFARQFGPLGLCKDGEPLSHPNSSGGVLLGGGDGEGYASVVSPPDPELFYCAPAQLADGWSGEPVQWWLTLANAMRATIDTILKLKNAERPARADLSTILNYLVYGMPSDSAIEQQPLILPDMFVPPGSEGRIDASRARAWTLALEQVNKWLQACPTRLHFTFTDAGRRRVDLSMSFTVGDQRGCFPALVFEVVRHIRGGQDYLLNVACAHCGNDFVPRSKPVPGRRAFCRTCRKEGWPMRYALRTQYKKKRTLELRDQGKNVAAIAKELKVSQPQVKRYLAKEQ